MLILSDADVAKSLSMKETLDALEHSFRSSAQGGTISGPWVQVFVNSPEAKARDLKLAGHQFRTASGYTPDSGVVALRISSQILHVGDMNGSVRRTIVPTASGKYVGMVLLFSTSTGEPLALFPDAHIQHFRVGATNGLGAKLMSRADSSRVALLGAGWQAEARVEAYCAVRKIKEIRVYSPRRESREDFCRRMTAVVGIPVVAVDTPASAAEGADIIGAATSSIEPVIEADWVRPGVHVDCLRDLEFSAGVLNRTDVAAYNRRDPVEAPIITCREQRATAFSTGTEGGYSEVDDRSGWWHDEKLWDKMTTLEELLAGTHPGRVRDDQSTLFLARGVAHQFSAVGAVVLNNAKRLGLGTQIDSSLVLQDRPT